MDRRQFLIASIATTIPNISSACMGEGMDPPSFFYVDPELNTFVEPKNNRYKSLQHFLDDQFGKTKWVISDEVIEPARRYGGFSWSRYTHFREKWKGTEEALVVTRPSGYFSFNPFFISVEVETRRPERTEISYFMEIINPQEMWGIGGKDNIYFPAAKISYEENVFDIEMKLALPLRSSVVVAIKKGNLSKVLVAQPIKGWPLICGGGIPVATQSFAERRNSELCNQAIEEAKKDYPPCQQLIKK